MAATSFTCAGCGNTFAVSAKALARFPGWKPRRCRSCKPASTVVHEENLTLAQVLDTYTDGPHTGWFTDGSCSPNPGSGGWGVVEVLDGQVRGQWHGYKEATTNNEMELTAICEALERIEVDSAPTVLYSDSTYAIGTLGAKSAEHGWAAAWRQNGWKRKGGPVKNLALVKRGLKLRESRPQVELAHIKAHNGSKWNEYADSLATAWMRDTL